MTSAQSAAPPASSPSLAAGAVAVWYLETGAMAFGDAEALATVLSTDERQRAGRFVFERDRRDFTAAHALLRRTLSLYGAERPEDWRFDVNSHGKPSVMTLQAGSPPLMFSLSHTQGLVACAVARGPAVGVDVERIRRPSPGAAIAARYFAASEIALLATGDQRESELRFAELWTLKESAVKAAGIGLVYGLRSFAFTLPGDWQVQLVKTPGKDLADLEFLLAEPQPGYRLAVAVGTAGLGRERHVALHDASRGSTPATRLRWSASVSSD